MKSIVILISGRGSNMASLIEAAAKGVLGARIAAVIANTFFAIAIGAACAFALLKISFGG